LPEFILKNHFCFNQSPKNTSSSASEKVQGLENRIDDREEVKGNNLILQEELNKLKSEKESLQELLNGKVTEYESRIKGLSELLDNSSKQIKLLEQQQQQQKVVEVTSAASAPSQAKKYCESVVPDAETNDEDTGNGVTR